MNYECVICLDLCKKPISCVRCEKLLCSLHVKKILNKCPHCRLEPFQFKQEPTVQNLIELQVYKRREKMKKDNVFKCLVEGCNFEGKYHAMTKHRRSKHFDEKIDEIIFPEEREKKIKRQALQKLFLNKIAWKNEIYKRQAIVLYTIAKGKCQFKHLMNMCKHVDLCKNKNCSKVYIGEDAAYIGDEERKITDCFDGAKFLYLF